MKTSKRLLSIVLMLAMLVSMFTVMAFAGDKVKVTLRFRGREMGHPELGADIMKRFAESLADTANVDKPAKLEGRNMLMFLAPKPVK